MTQDEIRQSLIIARTVTRWCSTTNSALVKIGNPSDRSIILRPNTIVGTISPVTAISPRTANAIMHNHSESSQARIDLTAALDKSFENPIFSDQQKTQFLDLCSRYRSVFSLNQEELERCTIAEAEFPLQKNTKPVHRHPSIGQTQEHKKSLINVSRISNQLALSIRARGHRRCLYVWLPQLMAPDVSVSITELLLTSSLSERHGQCPILSLM